MAGNNVAKKQVLIASAFSDSPSEIARITGVNISSVRKYIQKNAETIKEYRDMRDQFEMLQAKDAIETISENMLSFILAASNQVNNPEKLEKASLKDIMTAAGIAMDKFPGLFKKNEADGSESNSNGIVIQIVDNSLPEAEISRESGDNE